MGNLGRRIPRGAKPDKSLLAFASLFAGLAALKLVHLYCAVPLLAWCVWRYRDRWRGNGAFMAASAFLVLAGSSYLQSWLATGNPVYQRAFGKVLAGKFLSTEEQRAIATVGSSQLAVLGVGRALRLVARAAGAQGHEHGGRRPQHVTGMRSISSPAQART